MNPVSFFLSFFLEKTAFDLVFCYGHYNVIQLRYFWWNYFLNNFSLLVDLLRLVCLLMMVGTYSSWSVIICQQNVGSCTFSDEIFSSTTVFILLHMRQQSISYSEHLLFFFFRLFYLSTRFLFFWPLNLLPSV